VQGFPPRARGRTHFKKKTSLIGTSLPLLLPLDRKQVLVILALFVAAGGGWTFVAKRWCVRAQDGVRAPGVGENGKGRPGARGVAAGMGKEDRWGKGGHFWRQGPRRARKRSHARVPLVAALPRQKHRCVAALVQRYQQPRAVVAERNGHARLAHRLVRHAVRRDCSEGKVARAWGEIAVRREKGWGPVSKKNAMGRGSVNRL